MKEVGSGEDRESSGKKKGVVAMLLLKWKALYGVKFCNADCKYLTRGTAEE